MRILKSAYKIAIATLIFAFTSNISHADILVATGEAIVRVSDDGIHEFVSKPARALFYEEESEQVYFATAIGIYRADRGGNVTTIIADVGEYIGDLVVDASNERIIWTEPSKVRLRSANLDGSNISVFASTSSGPLGIAIDRDRGRVYWSTDLSDITFTDLEGANPQNVSINFPLPHFSTFESLALVGNNIYYTFYDSIRLLEDGSADQIIVVPDVLSTHGLAYDKSQERLYFVGQDVSSHLTSVNLDGSDPLLIAEIKGYDLIVNFEEGPEQIAEPTEPAPEPESPPAPEIRPPYTKMYMSIQNLYNPLKSRIISTNYYHELKTVSAPLQYFAPKALGYSKEQNSLYVVDRVSVNTTTIYRTSPDGTGRTLIRNVPHHYESIYVDDKTKRVFLGQPNDDFGTLRLDNQSVWRLFNRSGKNASGFAKLGNNLIWKNHNELLSTPANYNIKRKPPVNVIYAHYTAATAITDLIDGAVVLFTDGAGEDSVVTLYDGNKPEHRFGLYLGKRGYNYTHMAIQHLDPNTFDVPHVLYLASGNKVDILFPGTLRPVIIPFLRLDEGEIVTGMIEVPLDGSTSHNEEIDTETIKGTVRFVNFGTGAQTLQTSAAGISVHLSLESEAEQLQSDSIHHSTRSILTDADGNYEFKNLQKGATYNLRFSRGDVSFSSSTIRVKPGSLAPPVYANEEDVTDFGCNSKRINRPIRRADQINDRIVTFAIDRSARRISRVPLRRQNRIRNIANRLNVLHDSLLETSREIPSVRLQCVKTTTCSIENKRAAARVYRRKTLRISRVAQRLINVAFSDHRNHAALSARLNRMQSNGARITSRIPTRTFVCPTGPTRIEE